MATACSGSRVFGVCNDVCMQQNCVSKESCHCHAQLKSRRLVCCLLVVGDLICSTSSLQRFNCGRVLEFSLWSHAMLGSRGQGLMPVVCYHSQPKQWSTCCEAQSAAQFVPNIVTTCCLSLPVMAAWHGKDVGRCALQPLIAAVSRHTLQLYQSSRL